MTSRTSQLVNLACQKAGERATYSYSPVLRLLKDFHGLCQSRTVETREVAYAQEHVLKIRSKLERHAPGRHGLEEALAQADKVYQSALNWFRPPLAGTELEYVACYRQLSGAVGSWDSRPGDSKITFRKIALLDRILLAAEQLTHTRHFTDWSAGTRELYLRRAKGLAQDCLAHYPSADQAESGERFKIKQFAARLASIEVAWKAASDHLATRPPGRKRRKSEAQPEPQPVPQPMPQPVPEAPPAFTLDENPMLLAQDAPSEPGHWYKLDEDPPVSPCHAGEPGSDSDGADRGQLRREFAQILADCYARSPSPEGESYAEQFRRQLESTGGAEPLPAVRSRSSPSPSGS